MGLILPVCRGPEHLHLGCTCEDALHGWGTFAKTPKAPGSSKTQLQHPRPAGSQMGFLWWDFSSLLGADETHFQAFLRKHDGCDPLSLLLLRVRNLLILTPRATAESDQSGKAGIPC